MARSMKDLAAKLSVDELKHLLAVKEKLTKLEKRRSQLEKELAKIAAQIDKLVSGKPRRRAAKKTRKKTTRAKAKTVKKTARKAKAATKAARKKTARKPTVEAVVADLVRKNGKPMTFQAILAAITERKLVKTKSKKFDNVLRRTLSTSQKLKRVGRGVYDLS